MVPPTPGRPGPAGDRGVTAVDVLRLRPGTLRRERVPMRKFRERNLRLIAALTAAVLVAAVLLSLNLSRIPVLDGTRTYRALFANAGGLTSGDIVTVAGVRVGKVTGLSLDHGQVLCTFTVSRDVRIGSSSSAAMKVLTPIGQEYLEIGPSGPGRLSVPIPEVRTHIPETLVGDLSTLAAETGRLDVPQLERALQATTRTLSGVPKATVADALSGLARLSTVIARRQQDLSTLLTSASKVAGVVDTNRNELVRLVGQSTLILQVLEQRRNDIRQLLATTSRLGHSLTGVLDSNRAPLRTMLDNLDTVSAVLAKDSGAIGRALPLLAAFSRYSANLTGSGPWADFTLPTMLIPDNVIAECAGRKLSDPLKGCRA